MQNMPVLGSNSRPCRPASVPRCVDLALRSAFGLCHGQLNGKPRHIQSTPPWLAPERRCHHRRQLHFHTLSHNVPGQARHAEPTMSSASSDNTTNPFDYTRDLSDQEGITTKAFVLNLATGFILFTLQTTGFFLLKSSSIGRRI